MAYDILEPEPKGYDVLEPETPNARGYDVLEPEIPKSPEELFRDSAAGLDAALKVTGQAVGAWDIGRRSMEASQAERDPRNIAPWMFPGEASSLEPEPPPQPSRLPIPASSPFEQVMRARASRPPDLLPSQGNEQILEPKQPDVFDRLLSETAIAPVGVGKFTRGDAGQLTAPRFQYTPANVESENKAVTVPTQVSAAIGLLPEGALKDLSAGAYNAMAGLVNFFLSPQGWGTAGIYGAGPASLRTQLILEPSQLGTWRANAMRDIVANAPASAKRALSAGFAYQMATGAVDQFDAGDAAYKAGDTVGATQGWLGGLSSILFAGMAGSHAAFGAIHPLARADQWLNPKEPLPEGIRSVSESPQSQAPAEASQPSRLLGLDDKTPGETVATPATPGASPGRPGLVRSALDELQAQQRADAAAAQAPAQAPKTKLQTPTPDTTPATKEDLAKLADFIQNGGNNPFAPTKPAEAAPTPAPTNLPPPVTGPQTVKQPVTPSVVPGGGVVSPEQTNNEQPPVVHGSNEVAAPEKWQPVKGNDVVFLHNARSPGKLATVVQVQEDGGAKVYIKGDGVYVDARPDQLRPTRKEINQKLRADELAEAGDPVKVERDAKEFANLVEEYAPQLGLVDAQAYEDAALRGDGIANEKLRVRARENLARAAGVEGYQDNMPTERAKALPKLEAYLKQQFPDDNSIAKRRALADFARSETPAPTAAEQSARAKQDEAHLRRIAAQNPGDNELQGLTLHNPIRGASGPAGQLHGHTSRRVISAAEQQLLRELDRQQGTHTIIVDSPGEDLPFNGWKDRRSNVILIHARTPLLLLQVAGHEISHHIMLAHPGLYADMYDDLSKLIPPEQLERFKERLRARGQSTADRNAYVELIGDFFGDQFGRKSFWDDLKQRAPELFRRLARIVKAWLDKLLAKLKVAHPKGFESEQYFSDLQKARDIVADALVRAARETQYGKQGIAAGGMSQEEAGQFSKAAGGDEFGFDAPESVAEQKARLAREQSKVQSLKAKAGMQDQAAARLTGKDLDTTKEMFGAEVRQDKAGQGSLFSRPEVTRNKILADLRRGKIEPALGESADTIAIWELMDTLTLPEGWVIKDVIPSKHGSAYWQLEDRIGQKWKVSVRDHEFSPAREQEFGVSDDVAFVSDATNPQQFAEGMTRLEKSLIEQDPKLEAQRAKREATAKTQFAAKQADAPRKEYELAKISLEHYQRKVANKDWRTDRQEEIARELLAKWEGRWIEAQKNYAPENERASQGEKSVSGDSQASVLGSGSTKTGEGTSPQGPQSVKPEIKHGLFSKAEHPAYAELQAKAKDASNKLAEAVRQHGNVAARPPSMNQSALAWEFPDGSRQNFATQAELDAWGTEGRAGKAVKVSAQPWWADQDLADELMSPASYGTGKGENYLPRRGADIDAFVVYRGEAEPPGIKRVVDTQLGDASRISNSIYPVVDLQLANGTIIRRQIRVSDHGQVSRNAPYEYSYDVRWAGKTHQGRNLVRGLQDKIKTELAAAVDEVWSEQRTTLENANAPVAGGAAGIKTPLETQSQGPDVVKHGGRADKSNMSAGRPEEGSALTKATSPKPGEGTSPQGPQSVKPEIKHGLFSKGEQLKREQSAANYIRQRLFDEGALDDDTQYALKKLPPSQSAIADIESALWNVGEKRNWQEILDDEGDADHEFEGPDAKDVFTWAKQHHGTTDDINEAGYALPDGTLLDFSGKRHGGSAGTRAEDHRQIQYPDRPSEGYEAMMQFMRTGAVRIDGRSGAVDIATNPTAEQLRRIREVGENAGQLVLDMEDGKRKASVETENIEKGIGLIRRFYRGETLPAHQELFSKPENPAYAELQGKARETSDKLAEAVRQHGNVAARPPGMTNGEALKAKHEAAAAHRAAREALLRHPEYVRDLLTQAKELAQAAKAATDDAAKLDIGRQFEDTLAEIEQAPKKLVDKISQEMMARQPARGLPDYQPGRAQASPAGEEVAPDTFMERRQKALAQLPASARDWFTNMRKAKDQLAARIATAPLKELMAADFDSGETRAMQFGKQASNLVLHELNRAFGATGDRVAARNPTREAALTFFIEGGGTMEGLQEARELIVGSQHNRGKWADEALRAIKYAETHFARLAPVAEMYAALTDNQVLTENESGVSTIHREGGYVFHLQDILSQWAHGDLLAGSSGGGVAAPFKHIREHPTYAQALANGVNPRTLNAVDLLQKRLALGNKLVNARAWVQGMRRLVDPATQTPIITDTITKIKRNGETDTTAPPGYKVVSYAGHNVAIHSGYEGVFDALTAESKITKRTGGALAMNVAATTKHLTLLIDTYHLGRMAFWAAMVRGMSESGPGMFLPGAGWKYAKGLTLLDNTRQDIEEAARRGEIPQVWTKELVENKRLLDLLIRSNLHVGTTADNIFDQSVLHNLPVFSDFNHFLFQKFVRGAMAEAALIEFKRQKKMNPTVAEADLARRVSRDLNIRFGNLKSASWIKGRTFQDLARLLFLAPQWNESLIRSELGAVRDILKAPGDSFKSGRVNIGPLGRAVFGALFGTFLFNQIINFITRGTPTWENPEEGMGAKLSAWIPDLVGDGPGFFLNPMTLPAEITELLAKKTERSGDFTKAVHEYGMGRLSLPGRAAATFATRKDWTGASLRDGKEVAGEMLSNLVPVPMSAGAMYGVGKELVTGEKAEKFPGQFQRQAFQTFGIKLDSAPSADQRMRSLATKFNREADVKPGAEFFHGDYYDLDRALRIGNQTDLKQSLAAVLEKKTPEDVRKHYTRWANAPFTGQVARERDFVKTLNTEQRATYDKARVKRQELRAEVLKLLK